MGSTAGSCESSLWSLAASRLTLGPCCDCLGARLQGATRSRAWQCTWSTRATSDPALRGWPPPLRQRSPPLPFCGEGTALHEEQRRGEGRRPSRELCTLTLPLLLPERWTPLPDFPDFHKWGFSLAALNNSVYVTGGQTGLPLRLVGSHGLVKTLPELFMG